ncbi:ankyrin repeat-containing domain protein, partial [Gautieria morchelliformis]
AASYHRSEKVVRLLLCKGADVNAQGGWYGNALQATSYIGSDAVVRLLLENAADVNAQGGKYGSALQAAAASHSRRGMVIVRLLLEKGADINAQGGEHGSMLRAASSKHNNAIVQLLLKHGADSVMCRRRRWRYLRLSDQFDALNENNNQA